MYLLKTYKAGRTVEVYKTYSGRYGKKIPRGSNVNDTPDDVKKINERNSEATLTRELNANFIPGDLHIVLTYRVDERPVPEQAKKLLEKFNRDARAAYRSAGMEYKYIAVTEYENTALHHHLVIPYIDTRLLNKLWPYGRIRSFTPLDETGEYSKLAHYLIKETKKTFSKPGNASKRRWNGSKNLIHPKPDVKVVKYKEWKKQPQTIKGYVLDTDSIENGVSEVTGREMQHYRLIKIQNRKPGPVKRRSLRKIE